MKTHIINIFTLKVCLRSILVSFIFSFLMFGINFNRMAMPYQLYLLIVLIPALVAVISYLGYITRFVFLWNTSSDFDDVLTVIAIGGLLGLSLFLSLGMTLPTLNYPR